MATGDLQGNLARLESDLRKLRYPVAIDAAGASHGDPAAFLPLLHYALLGYSRLVARNLNARGYELQAKSDQRFVETTVKMLRNEFGYRSALTAKNFLTKGFAERKCLLIHDVVGLVSARHEDLSRESRQKVANSNLRSSLLSAFPPRRAESGRPLSAPSSRGRKAPLPAAATSSASLVRAPPRQPHVRVEVLRGSGGQSAAQVTRAQRVGLPRDGALRAIEREEKKDKIRRRMGLGAGGDGDARGGPQAPAAPGGEDADLGFRPPAAKNPAAPSAPPPSLQLQPRPSLPVPEEPPAAWEAEAATAPPASDSWAEEVPLEGLDGYAREGGGLSAFYAEEAEAEAGGREREAELSFSHPTPPAAAAPPSMSSRERDLEVLVGALQQRVARAEAEAAAAARREVGGLVERLERAVGEASLREERLMARITRLEGQVALSAPPAPLQATAGGGERPAARNAGVPRVPVAVAAWEARGTGGGGAGVGAGLGAGVRVGVTPAVGAIDSTTAEFLARVTSRFEAARQLLQAA